MDIDLILSTLHGWLFILVAFGVTLGIALFKGRQTLINLLMGAYLGLLLETRFPFMDALTKNTYGERAKAIAVIIVFAAFTFVSSLLFSRLMPREYLETAFESMGKKIVLALAATFLILTLSLYFLPVGELINIGTPVPKWLLDEQYSFGWLLLPLVALFFF